VISRVFTLLHQLSPSVTTSLYFVFSKLCLKFRPFWKTTLSIKNKINSFTHLYLTAKWVPASFPWQFLSFPQGIHLINAIGSFKLISYSKYGFAGGELFKMVLPLICVLKKYSLFTAGFNLLYNYQAWNVGYAWVSRCYFKEIPNFFWFTQDFSRLTAIEIKIYVTRAGKPYHKSQKKVLSYMIVW